MSRTIKQILQRRRESIFGIFPSLGRGDQDGKQLGQIRWTIYSWWDVSSKNQNIQVTQQGTKEAQARPNALFTIKVIQAAGPFTSSLNPKGGDIARLPSFNKNHWDLWLNFYIQHYPLITTWQWSSVNPFLTSGQPFLRIMQFRSKSCQCCK